MRKTIALASAAAVAVCIAGGLACSVPVDNEGGEGGAGSEGQRYRGGSHWGGDACNYPAWVAGKQYHTGDIVTYNGKLYIATHDNPGWPPTVSTYFWDPYTGNCGGTTSSGHTSGAATTGSGGGTCNYPAWVAGQQYHTGDIVTYNGKLFVATHDNPGWPPDVSTYYWSPYTGSGCGGSTSSGSSGSGGTGGAGGSGGTTSSSSSYSSGSGSTSSGSGSGGGTVGSTGKWVSGYYVGYLQSMYPASAIDWNGLTHLMIGRVVPNSDGSLNTTFDIDNTNGPAMAKNLTSLAHQHGRKAIIMLGGAGTISGWQGAASSSHRAAFVQNLVSMAQSYGVDGFDLDWEPISTSDQPAFLALAQALRAALPHAILTVPVNWTSGSSSAGSWFGQIAQYFDQINIMSYSMADAWPGWQSWHSSALYGAGSSTPSSVDTSVSAYLAAGVPAAKLGVGVGFYGTCWTSPVTGPKQNLGSSHVSAGDGTMTFDHIMSSYYASGSYHYDATAKAPYLSFPSSHGSESCTFVSYEDEASIADKGNYVKSKGLGGAIIWAINEGYRPSQPAGSRDPLMEAMAKAFLQ